MDNGDVPYSFGELNRIMAYANDKFKSGYMEHGGAIKNQYEGREPEDVWNNLSIDQRQHFIYDHANQIEELKGIELTSIEIKNAYNSKWIGLDPWIKNRFENHVREGQYAKGGMTDHNLMIGDTIKQSFGNILVVENDGKTYLVNINTGQRWTDSEWWSLSKGEITKYTKMAKGGEIKYSTYENKSMEYIEGEIAHTERSARQFQQMGDYESMEDRKEHVRKLREIYNRKRAESKMAKGGVVYTDLKDIPNLMDRVERGYVTYRGLGAFKEGTEITVDGKKYIVTDDDFNSIARDKDGNMRIRFSAPSRKRYEDGGYMAESGEVFYKESHKMGH
jgi:hypothetical protein